MAKHHFFLKLIPPRATFPYDITEAEKVLMTEHAAYMKQEFDAGRVLIYGPVLAPTNAFGLAVLEVEDDTEARQLLDADPTVKGGLNRYEIFPMIVAAARGN
jgi:uncharacterized protein YciI